MRTDLYNYFPANDHRKSLVFLQVGFNSMGYEERKQKPAYDRTSLLGKFFIIKTGAVLRSIIASCDVQPYWSCASLCM